jgi:hypothetical protein
VGGLPKMVRESSCAARTAVNGRALDRIDAARVPGWVTRLDVLIDAAHEHGCLDTVGTHRVRRTARCGSGGTIGYRSLAVERAR